MHGNRDGVGLLHRGFYINADIKDSKNNILNIVQSGLTLGQRDYYLENDAATQNIRNEYKKLIVDIFAHCGIAATESDAEAIVAMETRLAHKSKSQVELRDDEKNYHKMPYDSLLLQFPGIGWEAYFTAMGITGIKDVNVCQIEPLQEVEKILAEESLEHLKLMASLGSSLWRNLPGTENITYRIPAFRFRRLPMLTSSSAYNANSSPVYLFPDEVSRSEPSLSMAEFLEGL